MIPSPSLSLFVSLLLCVVLVVGCDSGGSNDPPDPEPAPSPPPAPDTSGGTDDSGSRTDCQSRTGNSMVASVDGTDLCTDIVNAQRSTALGNRLTVVGFFTNAGSSLTLNVDGPAVGTFDLTEVGAEHEGFYANSSGAGFAADRDEGRGRVTITTLTGSRVVGTFSFTGVNPSGGQAQVRGRFDVAVTTSVF